MAEESKRCGFISGDAKCHHRSKEKRYLTSMNTQTLLATNPTLSKNSTPHCKVSMGTFLSIESVQHMSSIRR